MPKTGQTKKSPEIKRGFLKLLCEIGIDTRIRLQRTNPVIKELRDAAHKQEERVHLRTDSELLCPLNNNIQMNLGDDLLNIYGFYQ